MSRSALSLVAVLALASRSALAQPDPADPTPLTAKTYAYPSGIASIPRLCPTVAGPDFVFTSLTKWTPSPMPSVVLRLGTTSATPPPRTRNPNVRPPSSTVLAVCLYLHSDQLYLTL